MNIAVISINKIDFRDKIDFPGQCHTFKKRYTLIIKIHVYLHVHVTTGSVSYHFTDIGLHNHLSNKIIMVHI